MSDEKGDLFSQFERLWAESESWQDADEEEFLAGLARKLGLEKPAYRLGEGEFYEPEYDTPRLWGRVEFVRRAAEIEPKLLESLVDDVFPFESGEDERGLKRAFAAWRERWCLLDDWIVPFVAYVSPRRYDDDDIRRYVRPPEDRAAMLREVKRTWGSVVVRYPPRSEPASPTMWFPSQLFKFQYSPWMPTMEWRSNYTAFVKHSFERALNEYLDDIERRAEAAGLKRTPEKRARSGDATLHYEWLARWQVQGWSYAAISKHYRVSKKTVETAIPKTAEEIGLTRRTLADAPR